MIVPVTLGLIGIGIGYGLYRVYQTPSLSPNQTAKGKDVTKKQKIVSPDYPTLGNQLLTAMANYFGYPYVWGGESVAEGGFDCSGWIQRAAIDMGLTDFPRTSRGMYNIVTTFITEGQAKRTPGAFVFLKDKSGVVRHVEVSTGNGETYGAWSGSKSDSRKWGWWLSNTQRMKWPVAEYGLMPLD